MRSLMKTVTILSLLLFALSMIHVSYAVVVAGGQLHDIVRSGDVEKIKRHIAEGGDVNAKDKKGNTPLHIAAGLAKKDIIELLITKGADVNISNTDGKVPVDIAKLSIKNIKKLGRQVVFAASKEEYKEVVKLLKKHMKSP